MAPSTGSSGDSQPSRRRRRGRRGSGNSAGRSGTAHGADGQAEPAGSQTGAPAGREADQQGTQPPAKSGRRSRRRRPGRSGRRPQPDGPPADPPAGPGAKPDGQPAGAPGAPAAGRPAMPAPGSTGKPRAASRPHQGSAGNGTNPSARDGKARTRGKYGKPGGRRLRTVDETSAGGLVVDADRASAALIGRLDRRGRLLWSLPKGHIESGETPEQAAIREVAEETGIAGRVLAPLGTIDYWFVAEDRRVHKTVHHFLMEAVGGELSDEDVEVTEVAWVPLAELDGRLAYADERRLVRLAADLLSETA